MKQKQSGVVVFAYGSQPMDFFSKVSKLSGDGAVLDQDVARMAGASFAIGPASIFDELRKRLETGSLIAQKVVTPNLSSAAQAWLANGRRGISSDTMFTVLTGLDALGDSSPSHPRDPDDFDRCLALLHAVPELRPKLPLMAKSSPAWAALIANWDQIERSHISEVGLGWTKAHSAPKTYELMRTILKAAEGGAP